MKSITKTLLTALLFFVTGFVYGQSEVVFNFNESNHATSSNDGNAGDLTENEVLTIYGVTLTATPAEEGKTTANRYWETVNGPQLRMYSGSITIEAPSGNAITKIVIANGRWNVGNTFNGEVSETGEWEGNASTVVLAIAGNTQMNSVIVTLANDLHEGVVEHPEIYPNPTEIVVNASERDYTESEQEGGQGQPWDNQFWIVANRSLSAGEVTYISFEYAADADARTTTHCHAEPTNYLHWVAIGDIDFSTEWQTFETTFTVPSEADGMQSIAFNLSEIKEANVYRIKNVVWKLEDDTESLINQAGSKNFYVRELGTLAHVFGDGTELVDYDINGDGVMDVADVGTIYSVMGDGSDFNADINGDGSVDVFDVSSIINIMASTDIVATPSGKTAISVEPFYIENGGTANLVINMDYKTTESVVGWSFTLYLPEGLKFNTNSTAPDILATCCSLSKDTHNLNDALLSVVKKNDGGYLFVLTNPDKTPLRSTVGQLLSINLKATSDVEGNGKIMGISLANNNNISLDMGNIADVEFNINSEDSNPDEGNENGVVIIDGVRQRPSYATQGFVSGEELYMLNVGSGQFFTQGNNWMTQASVGSEGRLVKFQSDGDYDYTMLCYCWRSSNDPGGYLSEGWRNVFFDSETALFVDRADQENYFFSVEDNGKTFRISTSQKNPSFSNYAGTGVYVGLPKNFSGTILSPFVSEEEAYVDWAFVNKEDYENMADAIALFEKAQELKSWIDRIEGQNCDATSLINVYLNKAATMDELQAAIDSALPIYRQTLINNATDKENVDLTFALVNPNYEDGESGWTVVAASGSGPNGRQGNVRPGGSGDNLCYEAWNNASFDIYQTIYDMPVGVYEIEVQGFYRYGRDATAWNAYLAQSVDYVKPSGVPVYIYLNNNATNFVNVFGDEKQITDIAFYSSGSGDFSSHSQNGTTYYFPNGMASAAIAFSNGMYKQSAFGLIANEGDELRIGVKGNSNQLNDSWCIWDNFKLYYRGFKPEVVLPVLETAIADLQQYSAMLMGRTEYEILSTAFADAQTAIDNNDGEAMFHALNALYDVKEAVIASKDIFLEQEVAADTLRLAEAISSIENKKLAKATLDNANTLLYNIKGNLVYENGEIDQLKYDVTQAINNLSESVTLYEELLGAINDLQTAANNYTEHSATLPDEISELLNNTMKQYNEGSVNDADIYDVIDNIYDKIDRLNSYLIASEWQILKTAYEQMNNGNGWKRTWNFDGESHSVAQLPGVEAQYGHVLYIDLSDNNLSGSFPYALLELPALQTLDLSSNNLTGDMGKGLQDYIGQHPDAGKSLMLLDISSNKLEGNIGLVASQLPALTELYASWNRFSEVSPMISRTVNVELGGQTLDSEISLSLKDMTAESLANQLPPIVLYNHSEQTFGPNVRLHLSQPSVSSDWHVYLYLNGIHVGEEANTSDYELSRMTCLNEKDDASPWSFDGGYDGQLFTISSGKTYQWAPQNTVKYSRNHNFSIGIPDGLTVHAVRFQGFSNADITEGTEYEYGYVSQFNGTDVAESDRVYFPARNANGYTANTVPMVENRFVLSQPLTGGTITFRFGGQQVAAIIYIEASDASDVANSDTETSMASYSISGTGAYYGKSGDLLSVDTGGEYSTPWDCTLTARLTFDEGDGNFDGQLDVNDLQSDINYILERTGYDYGPFNFTASNLWKDEIINIQDVICLVNLIMASEPQSSRCTEFAVGAGVKGDLQSPVPARSDARASSPSAELFVQDGKLMVNTSQPIAAFDIIVSGATAMGIASNLRQMGMTISTKVTSNGLRIIGYAMNGACIPAGISVIGTLDAETAVVSNAMLSDSKAKAISVAYGSTTTGIEFIEHSSWNNDTPVYDLQGRKIENRKSANRKLNKGLYIQNGHIIIK